MLFREAAIAALGLASASALSIDAKLQKRDGGGHSHGHDHAPADSGYGAPAQSYEEPAASYGAPAASYGAPAASYGAPAASYGAPAASYGAPSDSYGVSYGGYEEQDQFPDITPIIIGLLVLAGLSLLFPTFVSLSSVRRKRDAEDDINPMNDVVQRVNDIYSSVVASEECMERIACEVGGLAADVGLNGPAVQVASTFVPSKYKAYYKQFAAGKDCHKIKCGTFA